MRNAPAPKIFVNDIGGIHRLDGGIIEVTFIKKFDDPRRNPVEQGSLIGPEVNWFQYAGTLRWATQEIARGTFRRDGAGSRKDHEVRIGARALALRRRDRSIRGKRP